MTNWFLEMTTPSLTPLFCMITFLVGAWVGYQMRDDK